MDRRLGFAEVIARLYGGEEGCEWGIRVSRSRFTGVQKLINVLGVLEAPSGLGGGNKSQVEWTRETRAVVLRMKEGETRRRGCCC